jgi:hypothetical protein
MEIREMCIKFWSKDLKERRHFGDLDVDERTISKEVLRK